MSCKGCNNRGWNRSGGNAHYCRTCNRFKSDQEVRDWLKERQAKLYGEYCESAQRLTPQGVDKQ